MEEHECSCSGSEFAMVKRGAELISPSLLANIPKRSKDCHERLDMGEWTESSDESSMEGEAPNSNPPKN